MGAINYLWDLLASLLRFWAIGVLWMALLRVNKGEAADEGRCVLSGGGA